MMRTNQLVLCAVCTIVLGLSGCTQNPHLGSGGAAGWPTAATTAAPMPTPPMASAQPVGNPYQGQLADLERRVRHLDDNNRQLHTQLAQAEQQAQIHRDQAQVMREQLAELTGRMKDAHMAAADAQQKFQGLQASSRFRGGATITPNTNLRQAASQLNLGGLPVAFENNAIRIRVPSDQLFQPNTGQLLGTAAGLLDPVAQAIQTSFPRQKVGIEGYTDNGPIYGGMYTSNHQLSSAQASSVYEQLTRRNGLPTGQLFTLAQGPNYPRGDNSTALGRAMNRRVEIVIYPDTY